MKTLKGYAKNPYNLEPYIVERYIIVEVIEFCTMYMSKIDPIGVPKSRYEGSNEGKGTQGVSDSKI